jgi:hypothetical protein
MGTCLRRQRLLTVMVTDCGIVLAPATWPNNRYLPLSATVRN